MEKIISENIVVANQKNAQKLFELLSGDLEFHNQSSNYASHNFHSFAAKFPPQLPSKFILELTKFGDIVLDPMSGSGTTVLESFISGRNGIGFDIDPLALMMARVKVTPLNIEEVSSAGSTLLKNAILELNEQKESLEKFLLNRWDIKTKEFVDYWFEHDTQMELLALQTEINKIDDADLRRFFELTLSGIIVTKSGGVSLALDLAHTRPHRAKTIIHRVDRVKEDDTDENESINVDIYSTKYLHSALWEFNKKYQHNLMTLPRPLLGSMQPRIEQSNSQSLPLNDTTVDLIVTSPPYPSNAIDYMRAHKFSLVWFGYSIDELSQRRHHYIGSDGLNGTQLLELPDYTNKIVSSVRNQDQSKGTSLHKYYSEMTRSLKEMFRVLKPGRCAIVVVGNSQVRGINTDTAECLKEVGLQIGFEVPAIGVRKLDRNRRMMPAGYNTDLNSQIQQRMHEEQVIGFYKPIL